VGRDSHVRVSGYEDGQLVDVGDRETKEAGFGSGLSHCGCACARYDAGLLSGWQDYGAVWDTLFLAAAAFKRAGRGTSCPLK
jgi:hypothetical protein